MPHDWLGSESDLDVPAGDVDTGDGDLSYDTDDAIKTAGARMGKAAAMEPATPEACIEIAQTRSITEIDFDYLVPKKTALCVITDLGNVAWMRFLRSSSGQDLEFELTLWKQPNDQPVP
jgi:hypothetical protein